MNSAVVKVMATSLLNTIRRLDNIVPRAENIFANKKFQIRTERDDLCFRYLSLIFEHHRGTLLLLGANCCAPACSLMRPLTEGFLRLHVVMHGTQAQLESVKNDTYKTEFATVGELIDRVNGFQPLFGPLFGDIKDELHGFTHLGKQHLFRMANGADLGPNYPDEEIVGLMKYDTLLTIVAVVSAAKFLECPEAMDASQLLFDEYIASTQSSSVGRGLEQQPI